MKKLLISLVALSALALPVVASADSYYAAGRVTNNSNYVEHGTLWINTNELINKGSITANKLIIRANNIHSVHDHNLGKVCWKQLFVLNNQVASKHKACNK